MSSPLEVCEFRTSPDSRQLWFVDLQSGRARPPRQATKFKERPVGLHPIDADAVGGEERGGHEISEQKV
ncbi:hypothetical protein N7539_001069 [Penicillium diatomitis]|uniref:Uncharacterized protein n=1 Tax=Penicillium diatomitis TaxID=2819901 RepID=A0A9X0C2S4_9EURO|nr:uncharacterized protein N7539_001069 [Penicillium diatomitis]KAJ5495953.1 hypothetical protein N7539_001069 [Penicillium diatomitis]